MSEPLEPLITNKQLQALLSRAKGMSKTHRDTMWEALIFVRGSYEIERWRPVNPIAMANDEYADAEIKLCYRRAKDSSEP